MQQGGSATPFDRNMGTKMAAKAVVWIVDQLLRQKITGNQHPNITTAESVALLGMVKRQYKFTPIAELKDQTNFE